KFAEQYGLHGEPPIAASSLEQIITQTFGYELDDAQLARQPLLANYRSVYIAGAQPKLLLNAAFSPTQIKFLLARELGYQFLNIKNRANTSAPDKVDDSFQQVLNDFKASYFAGALLMPRSLILADLQELFQHSAWSPYRLQRMLDRYDVTPEMLFYRFSELIPQFFGLKLHFLRFQNADDDYRLVKQLNMSNLLLPHGINRLEHHCRRWLSVRLLKEMAAQPAATPGHNALLVKAQISEFLDSRDRFLEIGFARPLSLSPDVASSVVIGFRTDQDLKNTIQFVEDPALPAIIINQTCERCPLSEQQCAVRAAPPVILAEEKRKAEREMALKQLRASMQG
ncbi:MAG: ImmA/IrrE family metallo-endopeptidase, partial [Anaerolineae bacterium]